MLVETEQIEIMKKLKLIIKRRYGGHIFSVASIAKSIEDKIDNVEIYF